MLTKGRGASPFQGTLAQFVGGAETCDDDCINADGLEERVCIAERAYERNRPPGTVHFAVSDSKAGSTRPSTNQIEKRYEGDFVERSSGEKLLDTLLATCGYTFCGDSSSPSFFILFLGKLGENRKKQRMEDKVVATCKVWEKYTTSERRA
ncbi:hypothetical protein K0M31_010500 [Melipona bicolor]|uniref:Uncharacterized protein n=1 Tax=Melipona bicolor TaxID=60889 RepID=A0AA40KIA9_9HYME|nr:hypothetical protein K0M31_010500 [Melipona bicolor]